MASEYFEFDTETFVYKLWPRFSLNYLLFGGKNIFRNYSVFEESNINAKEIYKYNTIL